MTCSTPERVDGAERLGELPTATIRPRAARRFVGRGCNVRPVNRWHRYWFDEGGRYAAAIVRIAIAVAVLMSLSRLSTLSTLVAPEGLYRPVGIWMLLGRTPPAPALIDALWAIAWVSTFAMLVGAFTRASTVVSFVSAVALAAVSFSGRDTWSHQYNVVFLAQLAFLGARGGDVLSVDAVIRRLRGLPSRDEPRGYQWSLRLVQLAVALMFFCAFFYKIAHGHGTLRWALTDNLRHQLLMRYDLAGLDRPALVDWLLADVWRYRTAAMLNLVSQAAPILAVIFARRPLVRAAAGALFVTEVVALELVVSLWNPAWLPLAAVFVDWDALVGWGARRLGRPLPGPASTSATSFSPPRGRRTFIVVFVVYDVVTSFVPTLDQRLNTFPFSGFPMFAKLRVQPPYDEHRPFSVAADHVVALDTEIHARAQRWLDNHHRGIFRERSQARIRKKLEVILAKAPERYPELSIRGVRHYLAIFEAPAYPAPARFERHPVAITGELRPDGVFRSLLGSIRRTAGGLTVELRPANLDLTGDLRFVYYRDDQPTPIDVTPTSRTGTTFTFPALPGRPLYLVVLVDGLPWLVGTLSS